MAVATKGPKKVRIPGTNQWYVPSDLPAPEAIEEEPTVLADPAQRLAAGDAELAALIGRNTIEPRDRTSFEPWFHPWLRNVEIRPTHNTAIRYVNYEFVPRTETEDAFAREWTRKQRGRNDPERWHGRTLKADGKPIQMVCAFCSHKPVFTNENVYEDHLHHDHLREELADNRQR